jgi:hypothetical protein
MMANVSVVQRRVLALSLLAAVLGLGVNVMAVPVIQSFRDSDDGRRFALKTLRHDLALGRSDAAVLSAATLATSDPHATRWYAMGKETAQTAIESDVRGLVANPAITQAAMAPMPPALVGPLTRLGVKLSLTLPIDQLAELFARLAAHPKMLVIENLMVQAPDYQAIDSNPALTVQMDVQGFMRASGAAP